MNGRLRLTCKRNEKPDSDIVFGRFTPKGALFTLALFGAKVKALAARAMMTKCLIKTKIIKIYFSVICVRYIIHQTRFGDDAARAV